MITSGEFVILDQYMRSTNKFQKNLNKKKHELSLAYAQKRELVNYIQDLEGAVSYLSEQNKKLAEKLNDAGSELDDCERIIAALQKRLIQ